jgi:hypothetical protein
MRLNSGLRLDLRDRRRSGETKVEAVVLAHHSLASTSLNST